jgi:hypothetical protein
MEPLSPRSPPKRTRAAAFEPDSPDTPRKMAKRMKSQYAMMHKNTGAEMRHEMDKLVIGCALDPTTCDVSVPVLKHHATAYAARFGKPYDIPPNHMYMLHDEPNPVLRAAQLARAHQMADVANDAIHAKLKQVSVQSTGRSVMSKMLEQMQQPGESLNPYLQCPCDPMSLKRNPLCKVKPELCKHHMRHLPLNLHKKGGAKSKTQRNKRRNNRMTRRRR